jgi:hypothetical protein
MQLRQSIVTGKVYLSNLTTDIRDWYAGITARGGVHVLDNVHFTAGSKDFRQRLSDEICRIVTEPHPHVEMRKLYTTSQVLHLPVSTTMAVTSIEQPFYNTDLLQRAAIFELQAVGHEHDSEWVNHKLEMADGRIGWVAHHLVALHKFLELALAKGQWDPMYKARHRLANYEQCLILMSKVLGWEGGADWIPEALAYTIREHLTEGDWVHQGLQAYIDQLRQGNPDAYEFEAFTVQEIADWCTSSEVYSRNPILTNARSLGRYIQSHKLALEETLRIYEKGKKANRFIYSIRKAKEA